MKNRIMPTTYLLLAIIIMTPLGRFFPIVQWIHYPWNLLGIIPLISGVVLNLAADRKFHQANTTVKPFQESSALVTGGVFKICRNPMYSGFMFILVGIAILLGSLSSFFIVVAYFFVSPGFSSGWKNPCWRKDLVVSMRIIRKLSDGSYE